MLICFLDIIIEITYHRILSALVNLIMQDEKPFGLLVPIHGDFSVTPLRQGLEFPEHRGDPPNCLDAHQTSASRAARMYLRFVRRVDEP